MRHGIVEGQKEPQKRVARVVLPIDHDGDFPDSCVGRDGPPPHPGMLNSQEASAHAAAVAERAKERKLHPVLPPATGDAHVGEDDPLHLFDWPKEEDPRKMMLLNMNFWDDIPCELIQTHTAVTTRTVPDGLASTCGATH